MAVVRATAAAFCFSFFALISSAWIPSDLDVVQQAARGAAQCGCRRAAVTLAGGGSRQLKHDTAKADLAAEALLLDVEQEAQQTAKKKDKRKKR